MSNKHLVIPDVQSREDAPSDHLEWCGEYIVDKKPNTIVCLGDFWDMPSLNSYDERGSKHFENLRYKKDVQAGRLAMTRLMDPVFQYNLKAKADKKAQYHPRLVFLHGNHEDRITRAIEHNPAHLEGVISLDDLNLQHWGWEVVPFLTPIIIDGVLYNHYMPTGAKGLPAGSARMILQKHHMSAFCGHLQGRDIAYGKRGDGKKMTAIICGSFYLHDEDYMPPPNNQHWRGVWMLHEVKEGEFDEMPVSIDYLRRKYGNKQVEG